MTAELGELLADFDLGFLNSSNHELATTDKAEKQRKAILIAKRKTIATDSLLKKYYEKKEALDLMEKTLFESKVECKQVCIDYRNAIERIGVLEENERKLLETNRELEDRHLQLESQCSALQSHTHQLQELVKEQEKKIYTQEVDSMSDKLAMKESEKQLATLQQTKISLTEFIVSLKGIILGKDKLDSKIKIRLKKFCNKAAAIKSDDESGQEDDSDWIDNDHDDLSGNENVEAALTTADLSKNSDSIVHVFTDADRCGEISSSVDTGRGSSLASDSEKCLNSPDYLTNDSLIDIDQLSRRKQSVYCQDASTSPIAFAVEDESPKIFKVPAVNPKEILPIRPINSIPQNESIPYPRDCLKDNGRNVTEEFDDTEVTNILKELKMHFEIVTPIPPTPSSLFVRNDNNHTECPEAAKARAENKVLQSSLADLFKQVTEIKSMLGQQNDHTVPRNKSASEKEKTNVKRKINEDDYDFDNYASEPHKNQGKVNRSAVISDDEHSRDLVIVTSPRHSVCSDDEDDIAQNKKLTKIAERISFSDSSDNRDVDSVETIPVGIINNDKPQSCDIDIEQEDEKVRKRLIRRQRITKLEKMRLRLQPKSKISAPIASVRRRIITRLRPHPAVKQSAKKVIGESRNLNDKAVYEKAKVVAAEIRAKNKLEQERVLRRRTILPRRTPAPNEDAKSERCNEPEESNSQKQDIRRTRSTISVLKSSEKEVVDSKKACSKPQIGSNSVFSPPARVTTRSKAKEVVNDDVSAKCIKPPAKRPSSEDFTSDASTKRKLRSSLRTTTSETNNSRTPRGSVKFNNASKKACDDRCTSYEDLNIFTDADADADAVPPSPTPVIAKKITSVEGGNPIKNSILCKMVEKYGRKGGKRTHMRKVPDVSVVNNIIETITKGIEKVIESPATDAKTEMNRLVNELKLLKYKHFMVAFMKFLKDPERKTELLSVKSTPPMPPMSKSEQILLYVASQLNNHWTETTLVNEILRNIEYHIFRLNNTPEFAAIESMSHFYAVLCRFSKAKNRLRLFMLDAMYCIGYKAVPLIRQCISVWMHVLPLPHMRTAKNPMVVCLIYLLHFYKCEDRLNRVQEMRNILQRKYSYDLSEWTEQKMIQLFRTSIMELKDNKTEMSILRISIVIYAKRLGARWCEKNIIKNLLVPIIMNESNSERIRHYCISLLGPLVRPFPPEMRVHSEIVMNQLIDMLDQNLSHKLKEAVYMSLLHISRHDQRRVTRALLQWKPQCKISKDLEQMLCSFVQEKPIPQWILILKRFNI